MRGLQKTARAAGAAVIIGGTGDFGMITGTTGGTALVYGVDNVVQGVGTPKRV